MPEKISGRLRTIVELMNMLRGSRRAWMIPMFLVLGLLGLALVGLQAIPYVAPFIYSLF